MVAKTKNVEAPKIVENGTKDTSEQGYTFDVSEITARQFWEFETLRLNPVLDTDGQCKIMEIYVLTAPQDAVPIVKFKHFLELREGFTAALALTRAEAIGYTFYVEDITNDDVRLVLRHIRSHNIDKISEVMARYLTRQPKGISDLSELPYAVHATLFDNFQDAIKDLSKN